MTYSFEAGEPDNNQQNDQTENSNEQIVNDDDVEVNDVESDGKNVQVNVECKFNFL